MTGIGYTGMYQYPQYPQYGMHPYMRQEVPTPRGMSKNAFCGAMDDGKIDASTACREYFGGMFDCVKSLATPMGAAMAAGTAAICVAFPPAVPVIATIGLIASGVGLVSSFIKGLTAKDDQSKMNAFRRGGAATLGILAGLFGRLTNIGSKGALAGDTAKSANTALKTSKTALSKATRTHSKVKAKLAKAKIDNSKAEARLQQAKADKQTALTERNNAKTDLKKLNNRNSKATENEKLVAKANLALAEEKLAAAENAVTEAEKCTIANLEKAVTEAETEVTTAEKAVTDAQVAYNDFHAPADNASTLSEVGTRFKETMWNKGKFGQSVANWGKAYTYTGIGVANAKMIVGSEDKCFEDPMLRFYQQGMMGYNPYAMGGYGMSPYGMNPYGMNTYTSLDELRNIYNSQNLGSGMVS